MKLYLYEIRFYKDDTQGCTIDPKIDVDIKLRDLIFNESWMTWKKYVIYLDPEEYDGIYKVVFILSKRDIGLYRDGDKYEKGIVKFPRRILSNRMGIPFVVSEMKLSDTIMSLIHGKFKGHTQPFLRRKEESGPKKILIK